MLRIWLQKKINKSLDNNDYSNDSVFWCRTPINRIPSATETCGGRVGGGGGGADCAASSEEVPGSIPDRLKQKPGISVLSLSEKLEQRVKFIVRL